MDQDEEGHSSVSKGALSVRTNGDANSSGYLSKSGSDSDNPEPSVYQGVVFHLIETISGGYACKRRFLCISGKFIEMYKKDPNHHPDEKPIRQGVAGQLLMVEDIGRRKIKNEDLFVLRIYNRVDDRRKSEIACSTAEAAQTWLSAFQHAKDVAELEFQKGNGPHLIDRKNEFKLHGHRHHHHRAHGLTKLITIGRDSIFRSPARTGKDSSTDHRTDQNQETDINDEHEWRCVCTTNGIRILEDVTALEVEKFPILKSVGVVEATPSAICNLLTNINDSQRKEWDLLTGDLELVERIHGHLDIVHGCFDTKYLRRWRSKRDFVVYRHWRCDPDGSYCIIQIPTVHKDCPPKSGYRRIELNPSTWYIKPLIPRTGFTSLISLVTQTIEIKSTGWGPWKEKHYSKIEKTIPYVLLCQVSGLRDYFAANPGLGQVVSTQSISRSTRTNMYTRDVVDPKEEFYDAIAAETPTEDDEESDSDTENITVPRKSRFKGIAWAVILSVSKKRLAHEVVSESSPVVIKAGQFKGSLQVASNDKDSNCWADPGGSLFMVRGESYNKDFMKIPGGNPLLKLLAVDWFKSERKSEFIASNPDCFVRSEAARKLPLILVINLQVPANPNYSLVFYFAADMPIKKGSLLDKFANGDDTFRDSRFKLIPYIVEGSWVVKRAVGTKACLLGKAVTCNYYRENNIFEIDVDIGSSSVARSVISLVLGYVRSLVVDLAILIEGREEDELPEYLLGTVRIRNIDPESALPL